MLEGLRADPDDNGIGILDSTNGILKGPGREVPCGDEAHLERGWFCFIVLTPGEEEAWSMIL